MSALITPQSRAFLTEQLIRQEDFKQFPYKDSKGHLTIAIGRNLETVGIRFDEALLMCRNDIAAAETAINRNVSGYDILRLTEARKCVLINMCFNMGIDDLLKFRRMIAFIEKQDYVNAAQEMLNSMWSKQVGKRAEVLAAMMESGNFP